jgi:glycosyltransferase involved in cell wall biosynthesis
MEEEMEGIRVIRVWTYLAANRGVLRRICNYVSFFLDATYAVIRLAERFDVVVATSPQFFCGWAGVLVSRLLAAPLVLEIRDIWPESIRAVGAIQRKSVIGLLEWLEKRMYAAADRIVTVGPGYARELVARGVAECEIEIVPNGIDAEFAKGDEDKFGLRESEGLDRSSFIVTYAGTVGMAAGLSVVLRAADLLAAEGCDEGIVFLIVGSGAEKDELEEDARRRGLENVQFRGRVERPRVRRLLAASDLVLVHLRKTPLFRTVLPSKIFDAAGLGIPMVVGVEGDAAQLVEELGIGVAMAPESESELVHWVRYFRERPRERAMMSRVGGKRAREKYGRRALALRYERILEDVCWGSGRSNEASRAVGPVSGREG